MKECWNVEEYFVSSNKLSAWIAPCLKFRVPDIATSDCCQNSLFRKDRLIFWQNWAFKLLWNMWKLSQLLSLAPFAALIQDWARYSMTAWWSAWPKNLSIRGLPRQWRWFRSNLRKFWMGRKLWGCGANQMIRPNDFSCRPGLECQIRTETLGAS